MSKIWKLVQTIRRKNSQSSPTLKINSNMVIDRQVVAGTLAQRVVKKES